MRVLLDHPDSFKEGVRILMLTQRGKDGGAAKPDRAPKTKKVITQSIEEFNIKLAELEEMRSDEERIYSTIDERDMDKGIRIFKERQLDADYYDIESHHSFYVDIWNRWISALQSPQARRGTLFLIDIDKDEDNSNVDFDTEMQKLIEIPNTECVYVYKTKNGFHLITTPFNPALTNLKVQKNAMMLWAYSK